MSQNNDKGQFSFSRRKLLGSVATLGAAGALGGAGTMAFFSDEENFEDNQLTAGEFDLKIDWQQTYTGPDGTVPVNAYPDHDGDGWQSVERNGSVAEYQPGSPITLTCDELESGSRLPEGVYEGPAGSQDSLVRLDDVKPGDEGEITFSVHLCDNPGYLWLTGNLVSEAENGLTEPEENDEDETEGVVELTDEIRVTVWYDTDCDNEVDDDETVIIGGAEEPENNPTLREVLENLNDKNGIPLAGDQPAEDGGGTGRNCFSGSQQYCIGFKWELPVDHANEIQTDSVEFDLGFYAEQCRHNDGFPGEGTNGPFEKDLSTGVADWKVIASPDDTTGDAYASGRHPRWATYSTGECAAEWVDPYDNDPTESDPVGSYEYELQFDVPSPNPRDLVVVAFGADNPGSLALDGTQIKSNSDSEAYNPLDITVVRVENLSVGTHSLTATVENEPLSSGQNPTGLFVCAYLE